VLFAELADHARLPVAEQDNGKRRLRALVAQEVVQVPMAERVVHAIETGIAVAFLADAEAALAHREDVHAAVVEVFDLADAGGRAHAVRHRRAADFGADADEQHAERRVLFDAFADHGLVTLFEDMEGHAHAGEEDRLKRKEPQKHGGRMIAGWTRDAGRQMSEAEAGGRRQNCVRHSNDLLMRV